MVSNRLCDSHTSPISGTLGSGREARGENRSDDKKDEESDESRQEDVENGNDEEDEEDEDGVEDEDKGNTEWRTIHTPTLSYNPV